MAEPEDEREETAKPMLAVEEQIAHLKSKGVEFELCSEKEAAAHLTDETYFSKSPPIASSSRSASAANATGSTSTSTSGT